MVFTWYTVLTKYFLFLYRLHVKPSHSAQWIVNMNTAFAFMRDVEQLSLVNIGESQLQNMWCDTVREW